MAKKTALHELLAVEGNLENQAETAGKDLRSTFEKKTHLFSEAVVSFQSNQDGVPVEVESQSAIQSTIEKELKWLSGFYTKSLDASFQVAVTNTVASADIALESGEVIAANVPATALLELEKRLATLLDIFKAIPTLDPAKGFTEDTNRGDGYFRARTVTKTRTKKTKRVMVLAEPTKEHPAQVQLVDEDVPIGRVTTDEWSALITPARKSELLSRIEDLSRAVRQARARANSAEVDPSNKIGADIFNYILK